jgi:hypothetical protein
MSQVQQVVCCYSCHTFQGESPSVTHIVLFDKFVLQDITGFIKLDWLFDSPLTVVNENINIFSANCQEEQQQVAM